MIRVLVYLTPLLLLSALLAAGLSGLGHRWGWWSFGTGFSVLKWAVYAAIAALAASLPGLFFTRPGSGQSGFSLMLLVCVISSAMITVPAYWLYRAKQLPRIHDISTDTLEPPLFVDLLPLRSEATNTSVYGGSDIAALQRRAYPDITTITLPERPELVFKKAVAVAQRLGWEIVATVPDELRIEATDTTFWFGFKDDIVIRIRAEGDGSRVDIRSLSRVGLSDVGTNAQRIRSFTKRLVNNDDNAG